MKWKNRFMCPELSVHKKQKVFFRSRTGIKRVNAGKIQITKWRISEAISLSFLLLLLVLLCEPRRMTQRPFAYQFFWSCAQFNYNFFLQCGNEYATTDDTIAYLWTDIRPITIKPKCMSGRTANLKFVFQIMHFFLVRSVRISFSFFSFRVEYQKKH